MPFFKSLLKSVASVAPIPGASEIIDAVSEVAENLPEGISDAVSSVAENVDGISDAVSSLAENADGITDGLESLAEGDIDGLGDVTDGVSGAAEDVGEIADGVSGLAEDLGLDGLSDKADGVSSISDGVSSLAEGDLSGLNDIADGVESLKGDEPEGKRNGKKSAFNARSKARSNGRSNAKAAAAVNAASTINVKPWKALEASDLKSADPSKVIEFAKSVHGEMWRIFRIANTVTRKPEQAHMYAADILTKIQTLRKVSEQISPCCPPLQKTDPVLKKLEAGLEKGVGVLKKLKDQAEVLHKPVVKTREKLQKLGDALENAEELLKTKKKKKFDSAKNYMKSNTKKINSAVEKAKEAKQKHDAAARGLDTLLRVLLAFHKIANSVVKGAKAMDNAIGFSSSATEEKMNGLRMKALLDSFFAKINPMTGILVAIKDFEKKELKPIQKELKNVAGSLGPFDNITKQLQGKIK